VAQAQQIMYDAWEAPTRQRAVALAKKALTISADCADAYNLLANATSSEPNVNTRKERFAVTIVLSPACAPATVTA
jgi:hypothetical protein